MPRGGQQCEAGGGEQCRHCKRGCEHTEPGTEPAADKPAGDEDNTAASADKPSSSEKPVVASSSKAPPRSTKKPAPRATAKASAPFNVGAAKDALNAAAAKAGTCIGTSGKGKVQLTFATTGKVSSAQLTEGPFAGTTAGKCALRHFKAAKVPPFAGTPQTVAKSFKIP